MLSISEWVVSGGMFTILVFTLKNARDMNTTLTNMKKERDEKIVRIYERFDEYKNHFEEKHVSKDICQILNKQIKDDVSEIKADVKELLKLRKNGG
jgi:hypothetical protein